MPLIALDDVAVVRLDDRFNRQARSLLYHSYKDEPTFKYPYRSSCVNESENPLSTTDTQRAITVLGCEQKITIHND